MSIDRWLIAVSILWLGVLFQAPGLAESVLAFLATLSLIAVNALVSFRTLTHQREVLIGLSCVQIVLFGTLNYQLYCAFGTGHYQCDREPRFFDWIEFTLAHVLRAADVLDALDEYGVPIQTITHNSTPAGLLIVCMHVTVDVFLLGLLLRWLSRWWRAAAVRETHLARGRREFGWLLATAALFVLFAIGAEFRPLDWILWPLENLLRLVDVGDLFQVFGWQLHGVDGNYWARSAALLFRLAAGIWMARLVIWLRLRILRSWGLSIGELTELLDDPEGQMRSCAAAGLGQSGVLASDAAPLLMDRLHDPDPRVRLEAAHALGLIGPAGKDAALELADAVWLDEREVRLAAAQALGAIGPDAREALPALIALRKVCDEPMRAIVEAALERIAPGILRFVESHPMQSSTKDTKEHEMGKRALLRN